MLRKQIQQAKFNKHQLQSARKAKAWTMTRLADEVNLTRQAISQYEKGDANPSPEKLRDIASKLEQPLQYFTWNKKVEKQSPATFRSLASSAGRAREQAEVWIGIFATVVSVMQENVNLPKVSIPSFEIPDFTRLSYTDIDYMAIEARKFFGLGNGPISNLTLLLENHGILISFKKLNKNLSGLSQWYDGRPFILVDRIKSASRTRFSIAHELGHILLHQQLSSDSEILDKKIFKQIEDQANYFASSFMLPESALSNEVYGIDWESMVALKERWKMSIGAMAMRLNQVRIISDSQKIRIFRELSSRNARIHEPLDSSIRQDEPRLVRKVAELLDSEKVLTTSNIPDAMPINVDLMAELTQIPKEQLLPQPHYGNVISIIR